MAANTNPLANQGQGAGAPQGQPQHNQGRRGPQQQNQPGGPQGQQGRGQQQGPGQGRQNRGPQQPPRSRFRIIISSIDPETATTFGMTVRLYIESNDPANWRPGLVEDEPVHFFVNNVFTQVVITQANGEAQFTYTKRAGDAGITVRAVAQVEGNPSVEQQFVFNQPIAANAPPAPRPAPTPGLIVPIIHRRLFDDGSWEYTIGVSTEDRELFGQQVTFIGHRNRPVVVTFDQQGTAYADFTADLNTVEVNVLISVSGRPWQQVVNVQRPTEAGNVEVQCVTARWSHDNHLEIGVRALVDQTVWRNGKPVDLYIQGAGSVTVHTHDGIAEHLFVIHQADVVHLGHSIKFGALVMGTTEQDRSEVDFPVSNVGGQFVRGAAVGWWRPGKNFGLHLHESHGAFRAFMIMLLFASIHLALTAVAAPVLGLSKTFLPFYGIMMVIVGTIDWTFHRAKPKGVTKFALFGYGGFVLAVQLYIWVILPL